MKIKKQTFKATSLVALVIFACQSLGAIGITENLLGHWALDESDPQNLQVINSAPVADPEHGVRTAGIEVNQPAPTGAGYLFNGLTNNDYVDLGTSFSPILRLTNELTISAWINPAFLRSGSGANSRQTILGANTHLQFSLENEGQFVYVYRRDEAFVTVRFGNAPKVSAGEFIHVAITHEHDPDNFNDDAISLYVNGELFERVYPFPSIQNFEIDGNTLFLGRYEGNTTRDFDGLMSDVGLWAGRVLSHQEVAVTGGVGRAGFPLTSAEIDDLLAVYSAGEGTVTTGSWTWTYTNNVGTPADGSSLAMGKHFYGEDGNIYVILDGSAGAWTGLKAEGGIPFTLPIRIVQEPADQEVDFGGSAAFSVEVESPGPVQYQWFFGTYGSALALDGETTSVLHIENVGLSDEGTYFCEISKSDGDFSVTTRQAQLTVLNKPTPESGLVGHWRLDEMDPENLTVFNSVAGALEHGVRNPTIEVGQPSPIGNSYLFDGAVSDNHLVELGSWVGSELTETNSVTVSAWVNPDFFSQVSGANSRHIILATNFHFQFALHAQGQLFFFFRDGNSSNVTLVQSSEFEDRVRIGEWNHVAVRRTGSEAALYLNGVEVGYRNDLPADNFTMDTTQVRLGWDGANTVRVFSGLMNDVGLWSAESLTPQEISVIGGLGRIGLPLSSKLEMEEILALYNAQTGVVVTGDWEWSFVTSFPDPRDGSSIAMGKHYIDVNNEVYVVLGGSPGAWQGVRGAGGPLWGPPIEIVEEPQDLEVELGESATFHVTVNSAGDVKYQWFQKRYGATIRLDGETADTLHIEDVGHSDEGSYFCEISEINGDFSVTTRQAQLTVLNKPIAGPGLVGHWRLDETHPDTLLVNNSAAGAPEHGIRNPAIQVGHPSPIGNSYLFNGAVSDNHIVELGSWAGSGLTETNSVTVSAWVNPDFFSQVAGANSRHIILATNFHFQFALHAQGQLFFFFRDGNSSNVTLVQSSDFEERVRIGEWNHVAVRRTGSEAALYLNGVEVGYRDDLPVDNFTMDVNQVRLGWEGVNTVRVFSGLMSDVGLWSAASLTPQEISVIGALGRVGVPLSAATEMEAILAVYNAQSGVVVTGGWEWSPTEIFAVPGDGSAIALGRHYVGEDNKVYVVLGGSEGAWTGMVAEAADLEGFTEWVEKNFNEDEQANPNISGPYATPLGDGVSNLMKYAFGMEPKVPAPRERLPQSVVEDGELTFTYTRAKALSDVDFEIEFSVDLIDWEPVSEFTEQIVDDIETEYVTVKPIGLSDDFDRMFLRLRALLRDF